MDKSLPFVLHSSRGVYALLLGSGVSRSAGIMTGWDIVMDLVRKLAHQLGEDCGAAPEVWYANKFRNEPDYPMILNELGKTSAQRAQILSNYFEPTDEERASGLKRPTAAHKAIASMVAKGIFRVIVTTNFDRLIEQALDAEGVSPTIVSTSDGVAGMQPLVHSRCTLVKLHGDYRDTRIKNTEDELCHYEDGIKKLLAQIFDEYGLIICGWSAEWDSALRSAIESCPTRRFPTYWAIKDQLGDKGKRLAQARNAVVIEIGEADSFFAELAGSVDALDTYTPTSSSAIALSVARVKRNIETNQKILLHDQFTRAVKDLLEIIHSEKFDVNNPRPSPETLLDRMKLYDSVTEHVASMFASLCYWGSNGDARTVVYTLEEVSRFEVTGGFELWTNMRAYPALLLLYSGGISALAAGNYEILASLVNKPKIRNSRSREHTYDALHPYRLLNADLLRKTKEYERRLRPHNDHLFQVMKEWLREQVLSDLAFEEVFDRFEYLLALRAAEDKELYLGRFSWKYYPESPDSLVSRIETEIKEERENWPPVRFGLLSDGIDKILENKKALDTEAAKIRFM